MTRRSVGLALLVLGGVVAVIGLIGMFTSGDSGEKEALSTTTTRSIKTTTTTMATTSTTEAPETTTTSQAATTTTLDAAAAIGTFVKEFSETIERQDIDSLMAALHAAVLEVFSEELCRAFIEDEILLLGGYRLSGPIQKPTPQTIGSFTVDMYTGPVAFTFQGQDFEFDASFAIEEGGVTWFTECR